MSSNTISDAFALTRVTVDENLPVEVEVGGEKKLPQDFDRTRSNILDVIDTTQKAVQEAYNLASQSQAPRWFEALNGLLKTAVEANRSLLDIHETVRRTSILKQPQAAVQVGTQNNLYITTSQLQEMIANAKSGTIKAIEHQ